MLLSSLGFGCLLAPQLLFLSFVFLLTDMPSWNSLASQPSPVQWKQSRNLFVAFALFSSFFHVLFLARSL
jgi:hypothetical protein